MTYFDYGLNYSFKSFKVYWAYLWSEAEQMDRVGARTQLVAGSGMFATYHTNYASKYKRTSTGNNESYLK